LSVQAFYNSFYSLVLNLLIKGPDFAFGLARLVQKKKRFLETPKLFFLSVCPFFKADKPFLENQFVCLLLFFC